MRAPEAAPDAAPHGRPKLPMVNRFRPATSTGDALGVSSVIWHPPMTMEFAMRNTTSSVDVWVEALGCWPDALPVSSRVLPSVLPAVLPRMAPPPAGMPPQARACACSCMERSKLLLLSMLMLLRWLALPTARQCAALPLAPPLLPPLGPAAAAGEEGADSTKLLA